MSALKLATENGRRVGKVTKAKRLAAEPATEAARLRRCIARIRAEAERSLSYAADQEAVLKHCFSAVSPGDMVLARALAREALVSGPSAYQFRGLIRSCEMAEEGTLCA